MAFGQLMRKTAQSLRSSGVLGKFWTQSPLTPILCLRAGDSTQHRLWPQCLYRCAENFLVRMVTRQANTDATGINQDDLTAPILSSLLRIVLVLARANSLLLKARRLQAIIRL